MIDINSLGEKKGSQPVAGYRGDWLSEDLLSSMPIFLSLNKVFIFIFAFVNLVYLLCIANIKYTLKMCLDSIFLYRDDLVMKG